METHTPPHTWKRNGIEQGYTETDHLSLWCIYIHSIPEVSDISHQENSHLKEFMIRTGKRPEMREKKLGTEMEMGSKSHRIINLRL